MLTIFTSPRPFKGEFDIIQRNAIQSWTSVCPGCEIILIGDDWGTDKAASDFNVRYIGRVQRNGNGDILRNSVFEKAQELSQNELLCFISSDIILTSDFLKAVNLIRLKFSQFLLSGRRWDLDIKEAINFNSNWEEKLKDEVKNRGRLHGPAAGDYFVFPRSLDIAMPPFSIKHGGWDNWFIYRLKSLGLPLIDATQAITIVHQNHNGHHKKEVKSLWRTKEGKRELKMAGGFSSMLTLREADWILLSDLKLKRPSFPRRIFSLLSLFSPWRRLLSIKRTIQQYL